jgi:hypothetical protein
MDIMELGGDGRQKMSVISVHAVSVARNASGVVMS